MTVKELTKGLYDPKLVRELEEYALNSLLSIYCPNTKIQYGIFNCLLKNGIFSIGQLKSTKIEDIKSYYLLGPLRKPFLIKVKEFLDTLEDD